jgi:hypothetical protein
MSSNDQLQSAFEEEGLLVAMPALHLALKGSKFHWNVILKMAAAPRSEPDVLFSVRSIGAISEGPDSGSVCLSMTCVPSRSA